MKKVKNILLVIVLISIGIVTSSCKQDKKVVSIIQYISATALDNAREGIIEGLKENGYVNGDNITIKVYNPQGKADTLATMAKTAVDKSDLIIAIATPAALAVKSELEKQDSNVPMLFTAVTDPYEALIMDKNKSERISGTTDINPVEEQIKIIKEINPNASKIGFIYTASESNSTIQLRLAKEAASKLNIEIIDRSCSNTTDLELVAESLINSNIDALYVPTDNEIASQMQLLSSICNQNKIVTICAEIGELKDGGTITVGSVDYFELGKITGKMGASVFDGEDITKMSVQKWESSDIEINKTKIDEYNLPIPEELIKKAKKLY